MGKKRFIDKKKSATFQLIARDFSDPLYDDSPGNDRVFVRVDNNLSYSTENFKGENEAEGDDDSIFADAPEDCDAGDSANSSRSLPDKVRKEILELGFPDDGYNYLYHMREIKNLGGGSAFYNNPKTRLDQIPNDIKAYDASRLQISSARDERDDKYMYNVASETVGVRVQKALDPEVAALLNDDDLSRFGSDVEDFEEDFVIQANLLGDDEDVSAVKGSNSHEQIDSFENDDRFADPEIEAESSSHMEFKYPVNEAKIEKAVEEPRVRRLLDEQFDILESQEYGSNDEDEAEGYDSEAEEEISLAEKLKRKVDLKYDDTDVVDLAGNYKAPGDLLRPGDNPKRAEHADSARVVIRRCVEYGEKYENVDPKDEVVMFEESSDESEVWDCETVISTYSNLDNHPGQIQAPDGRAQKKKLLEAVFGAVNSTNQKIVLKGREKMPVDFLPNGRKTISEKPKAEEGLKTETQKRKQHGLESKEDKKERKAAVKEERRVARQMKKEMKGLFKGEALHAQKVAASTRPSIHLM